VVSVLLSVGVLHDGSLISSPLLGAIGAVVFASGIVSDLATSGTSLGSLE
jgi:hypothetical protein